jgi:phytoene dehydrogenase-like protein
MTRVVIIGGGPGGYESALVAAQLGADVTVVDRDGLGGSAVLTDCVPSKTLIATAEVMTLADYSGDLGVRIGGGLPASGLVSVDLAAVNDRVKRLAHAQSLDIEARVVSTARPESSRQGLTASSRRSTRTPCSSPRVRAHGSSRVRSPTASASSAGSRSMTSTTSLSGSSSSGPA